MIATMAMTVACKKSTPEGASGPVGSGSAVGSNSGSEAATGSSGAGSGSAEAPSPGSGSAAPSNVGSGSAASAGSSSGSSAGSGAGSDPRSSAGGSSGTGSGAGSAAGGSEHSGYDKVAFLHDPFCIQVADKIRECVDKPEFIAVLDEGVTRRRKRRNERLREGVKNWKTSEEMCTRVWGMMNYEHTGFVDNPAPLKAPRALSSCEALARAVKAAGGLVSGRTVE
jgi:hypothetical protein